MLIGLLDMDPRMIKATYEPRTLWAIVCFYAFVDRLVDKFVLLDLEGVRFWAWWMTWFCFELCSVM